MNIIMIQHSILKLLTYCTFEFVSYNDNISDTNDDFEMIIYLDEGTYLLGVSAIDDSVTFGLFSII